MQAKLRMFMSITAIGTVALAVLSATPARAEEATPTTGLTVDADEAHAMMEAQVPIDRLIEQIQAADKGGPDSGLAGLRSDPAHRALEVYWHGDLPSGVSDQITAGRADGITVTVLPAPYTRDELLAETQRLADRNMIDDDAEVQLATVGPKFDGSGLDVGVSGLDKSLPAAQVASRAQQLLPNLTSTVPMDITVAERPELATRINDTAPFWGGALMALTGGGYCSTGFGVTGNNGAATYILTANHCGHGEWHTIYQTHIGNTVAGAIDRPHDSQLLLGGSAGRHIYTGDYFNGANQSAAPVRGAVPSATGGYVCTSGAFSGTICGIVVVATGVTINVIDYGQMTHMTVADHPTQAAVGEGDSGGPAVSETTDGVLARGTISAMDPGLRFPCTGYRDRECSQRVFFPDINRQLAGVGARLNTG